MMTSKKAVSELNFGTAFFKVFLQFYIDFITFTSYYKLLFNT